MTSIAILGGGLSGLSSAFHLARRFPNYHITLLERQPELGGWVKSQKVHLSNQDSVLLEGGPRTLRPNGKSVLELINLLDLVDQVITVPRSSPAATSRYLYLPPSSSPFSIKGLQRIPTTTKELLSSPLTLILLPSILKESFTSPNRPVGVTDESFDDLLTRRFGDDFARILGSALVHGIYASDSRKLSVQSAFSSLWELEDAGRGSITRGGLVYALKQLVQTKSKPKSEQYHLGKLPELMKHVSVYSFKNGIQTLIHALQSHLQRLPNIKIITNAQVNSITKLQPGTFQITHSSSQSLYASHLISSLSPQSLKSLLRPSPYLPIPPHTTKLMSTNPLSSVQVLNLVFPCPPKHIHPQGFGYLVPRPPEDYATWNGPPILGMVFDSCSLYAQDQNQMSEEEYYQHGKFTKVTVMLGGPYGIPPSSFNIQSLLSTLSTHLSRPLPSPIYHKSWFNHHCIPTLLPGHLERVQQLRLLIEGQVGSETGIRMVGAGVDGVSVPDCVESGRRVAATFV